MDLVALEQATRHLLDELDVNNSHYSSARLRLWLNEAQVDIARRLPVPLLPKLAVVKKIHLSVNVKEYNFTDEFLKIEMALLYNTPAPILPLSYLEAIEKNTNYLPTTTNPFVIRYGTKLYVYPTPSQSIANGLHIYYIKPPPVLGDDCIIPQIPEFTHFWMVDYAVYKALLEDKDPRSEQLFAKYLERFAVYKGG